jgi:hypothetical protein
MDNLKKFNIEEVKKYKSKEAFLLKHTHIANAEAIYDYCNPPKVEKKKEKE